MDTALLSRIQFAFTIGFHYIFPPLSTVKQPFYRQGETGMRLLVDMIMNGAQPDDVILSTELTIRQSCGCSPAKIDEKLKEKILSCSARQTTVK